VPSWFKDYCGQKRLPVDCKKATASPIDQDLILQIFSEAKYFSSVSTALGVGLGAAGRRSLGFFEVLQQIVDEFDGELEFDRLAEISATKLKWQRALSTMPEVTSKSMRASSGRYTIRFLSNGKTFGLIITDRDDNVILSDGPRWILFKDDPKKKALSTSMTTVRVDPKHQSQGLYQASLNFYLSGLGLNRLQLYTENEETLEFLYRLRLTLLDQEKRDIFFGLKPVRNFLKKLRVDLNGASVGQVKPIANVFSAFAALSLQGRSRLRIGFDFPANINKPTHLISRRLSRAEFRKWSSAVDEFFGDFREFHVEGLNDAQRAVLPVTLLQQIESFIPACSRLFVRKSS